MNVKSFAGFALGPLVLAALGLITLPIMAWIFSPEDLGRLNVLQVTISFSLLLTVLGLDQAYVREFHDSFNKNLLFRYCFFPGFAFLSVLILVSLPFSSVLTYWLFGMTNSWLNTLVVLCLPVAYISRFLSLILRMEERGLAYSMSQILPKILQLLLLAALVWSGVKRDFLALLWISVASMCSVAIIYTWNTRFQWRPAVGLELDIRKIKSLLNFGLPLVFSGLGYWGLTASSTLVMRYGSSLNELGVYAVACSFAGAVAIFQSIFTVIWSPTVYKWASQGVDMTRVDAVARQALLIVCIIFIMAGTSSWIVDYILPIHYAGVKYIVLCVIVPPLLYTLSEITCVGIGLSRRTVLTVWVTLAALLTNVLLNLWLVPTNGAAGAVISNSLAYLVFFIARTEASAHVWRQFPRKKLYLFVGLVTALAVVTVTLGPALPFHYAYIWLGLIPVVGWSFRAEWDELFVIGSKAWRNRSNDLN